MLINNEYYFECPECDLTIEDEETLDRLEHFRGDPLCPECGCMGTVYDLREE